MIYMRTSRLRRLLAIAWLLSIMSVTVMGDESFKVTKGFTGKGSEFALEKGKEGLLITKSTLKPGNYQLLADYRTVGIDPTGKIATDIMSTNWKTKYSGYEWSCASSDWAPLVVFFQMPKSANAQIRFGNWQKARDGAQLYLRNLRIEPFEMEPERNWLTNGDWSIGKRGELPPGWQWKGKEFPAQQYCTAENTTFKSGKNILKMTGDEKATPTISYRQMPLPKNGEIEFSAWVRSTVPQSHLTMHIVCDGWNPRVEGGGRVDKSWKKLTAKLTVPTDGKKKWFFVRFDAKVKGTIEIADAKVIWYRSGRKADSGIEESWAGWQGAPGANLIYNPDMELGGTGYYYDYSWPKKYDHYESIRKTKPTVFLEGKGVDGGTCAYVQRGDIRAWCFPVTVGKTYTYSVDLRAPEGTASADASVLSFDTEWKAALWKKVSNVPRDRWQRYSWTIKWSNHNIQKRGYVRIGTSTGLLVDRLQVIEGTDKEYQAPPVMLGLTFPNKPYFVRGRDELKATIKVVPGIKRSGDANVTVIARDAWKREAWKKTMSVPLDKVSKIPVDLSGSKLGTFHVELKAEVDGKIAGIGVNRYAVIDSPVLQKTSLGKPGIFGICQESFNYPVWLCKEHAQIHRDLGIRLNRFFASVPPDMPYPIPQDFIDDLLAKCKPFREAGVDVMPCVGLIPKRTADACANMEMPKQADLDSYQRYLRAYVKALSPEVKYWEIFNEPNLWRVPSGKNKGKSTMYPAKYFEFQKVAYKTIKDIDPNLQVVCNALNNLPEKWINDWMKLGAGDYMDIFSFHPYGWTNFYPESIKLRATLAEHGFKKPILNSEKYFGCNIFQDRAGYEETRRGYYYPHHMELNTAGRSLRHYISHAADRVPYCAFAPTGTLFSNGPGNEIFLYDFFSAYNAATRFLIPAGSGSMIDLGPSMTAFIFPEAKEGPLLVIWTPLKSVEASMQGLVGDYRVYDIMGNVVQGEELKKGIRVANDPTYIRFKKGTSVASIKSGLSAADVLGLGDPFKVDVAVTGSKKLTAMITSCRNKPISGKVKLMKLPSGWQTKNTQLAFNDLQPGKRTTVDFVFDQLNVKSMEQYGVSVLAESGDDFVRRDVVIRPVFATKMDTVKVDGKLSEWTDAAWLELGEKQLSKNFNPDLKHNGSKDLSARVAFGWTEKYFALAVEVTDDVHRTSKSELLGWEADSIQVYFDPRNDASEATGLQTEEDVNYTIAEIGGKPVAWVDKGAQANYKGPANKAEAFNDVDVDLKINRVGNKTIYEIVFPRDRCIPAAKLNNGGNLGFSLLINDNDGKGRKVGLTLAPAGKEPYGAPHEYRDVLLIGRRPQ